MHVTEITVFQTIVDVETMLPTERLSPSGIAWCKSIGSSATTVSDILNRRDEKVLKALQAGIDRANERAISRAQKIQKWSVLPADFSIPGGELGTCSVVMCSVECHSSFSSK